MANATFVTLPNRGLITITGNDRVSFLQGLVSNDVEKLEEQKIQYACLLTPQGKFLHDFFLVHEEDKILIDCEGGDRAQDLHDRLKKYRLRSKVDLTVQQKNDVYVVTEGDGDGLPDSLPDPRHFKLGTRSFIRPDNALEESFLEWDKERILLGIPDGSRDMIVDKSTMLECALDKLNAIDWDKGCWMGQELTARMKYRNLGKKHLCTVKLKTVPAPAPFSPLEIDGKTIGDIRSSCGDIALAMIKDEFVESLKDDQHSLRILG